MHARTRIVLVAGLAVLLTAALAAQATAARKSGRLIAFGSCPQLLDYAKSHAAGFVTAYGVGRPVGIATGKLLTPGIATPSAAAADSGAAASSQQGVDYSGTNVQEAGVDEPDIVKTNGTTMFAFFNGQVNAVDVSGTAPKLLDTLKIDSGWSQELLLSGTHLLVLSRGGYWAEPLPAQPAMMIRPQSSDSVLTEVDVSDPSNMKVVKTLTLDGAYVDARMVGSVVRIVSSSPMPIELPTVSPAGSTVTALATAKTKNKAVVARSRVSAWLPGYRLGKGASHSLVSCRDVSRPVQFSGLGMLTVLTVDLSKGLAPVDSIGVMTDGRIVYASPTSLYVATEQWSYRPDPSDPTQPPTSNVTTQIHKFDISDPTKTTYLGSGTVPGYLLNQWSLSDFQGVLRVVSTGTPAWWGTGPASQSYLTTLRSQDGALVQVGQVGGLGQGERVYAVRMIGNDGYVVTFKQVDPLTTVDLSDPAHPVVAGELTIPGYSAYLHPISDNLLLGIGQNVDPTTNEPTGTQVSLFDVSDLKSPKLLQQASLGQGWSAAESDHHAFLYWPATNLVVVPFGQQAVAMTVSRTGGISELGRIVHTAANQSTLPQIQRSLVVSGALLTVSDAGVLGDSLSRLSPFGFAAFPAPAPSPVPVPGPIPGPIAITGVAKH